MRKVIVTKASYISFDELARNPRVRKHWLLPRGFMLIEMMHPASRGAAAKRAQPQIAAALEEEAALFAPFYRRVRSLAEIMTLQIRTRTASYHLCAAGPTIVRWPNLRVPDGWDVQTAMDITCKFSTSIAARMSIRRIFNEWRSCLTGLGELATFEARSRVAGQYAGKCKFTGCCGDATIALLILLAGEGARLRLQSVHLSAEPDASQPGDNCTRTATRPYSSLGAIS
jgi:hypothetical protein